MNIGLHSFYSTGPLDSRVYELQCMSDDYDDCDDYDDYDDDNNQDDHGYFGIASIICTLQEVNWSPVLGFFFPPFCQDHQCKNCLST